MKKSLGPWFPSINKWCDQTGISHLLSDRSVSSRPLCGARPFTLGNGCDSAEELGTEECAECRKRAERGTSFYQGAGT
jgi:hypothetical protein